MLKHADEIKEIEQTEMTNSWEMTRHWRNYRNRMDLGCWDYMVVPNELKFIRDVIQAFAHRHSGIQHFEHVELDEWRRKVNVNQDNKKLRIDYILKEITEAEMKTKLLKKERQMKKATAIHDVYELYTRISFVCYLREKLINCPDDIDPRYLTKSGHSKIKDE